MDKNLIPPNNAINKWTKDLDTEDTEMKLQSICGQIFTIIPVKLGSLYFKFILIDLLCNHILYKMCNIAIMFHKHLCMHMP